MKVILIIVIIIIAIVTLWYLDIIRYFKKAKFSGKEKAKHVIIISLDGIFEKDFEKLCNMKAFKELIKMGSYSNKVKTVYPTLTYPVHTSIITGVYPNKHGVIHNNQFQPGISENMQTWFWYTNQVKTNSLFDIVKIKNLKTCSLFWPVTGGGNIDYNIPEILALEGENQSLKILKAGTANYLLREELKYKNLRDGIKQPALDKFTTKVAVDTIINKKPNLLTMHLVAVDYLRHGYGVWSKEADEGALVYNNSILEVIEATKKAGIYNDSIFVITTDHGLIDINTNVYINSILRNNGFIKDINGSVEYTAYAQSLGLGAYIYIKDNDKCIENEVKELFNNFIEDEKYGIEKIYSKDELKDLKGDLSYSFAIEAKSGFAFKDEVTNYEIKQQKELGKKYATHGYSPLKDGYKNVFLIAGEGIKKNNNIGEMNIVDIAPTIAKILDIDYDGFDGKSLDDVFIK
ncbi:MAG: alkaline phosphatase family protein [Clostridium sp.]